MQRCCCFSNVRSGSMACGIYSLVSFKKLFTFKGKKKIIIIQNVFEMKVDRHRSEKEPKEQPNVLPTFQRLHEPLENVVYLLEMRLSSLLYDCMTMMIVRRNLIAMSQYIVNVSCSFRKNRVITEVTLLGSSNVVKMVSSPLQVTSNLTPGGVKQIVKNQSFL